MHIEVDDIIIRNKKYTVLSVDVIVHDENGNILVGQKVSQPHKGRYMLPGGLVNIMDDNIEASILRGVKEVFGIDIVLTHLVDVVGNPYMKPPADPRFNAVQVLYEAILHRGSTVHPNANIISEYTWVSPTHLGWKKFAFNHKYLIELYNEKLKSQTLLPMQRSFYTENFGKVYQYEESEYMHTVVMGIALNDQNEILLAHRAKSPFKDYWDFPGGHMYEYESIEECLKREVLEELGVECKIKNLFQVYSDKGMSPRFARAMVLYFIELKGSEFIRNVEVDGFQYFSLDKPPENMGYHADRVLGDIKKYLSTNK